MYYFINPVGILGTALYNCMYCYKGYTEKQREEYFLNHFLSDLEDELKIKDYLVNIVRYVNKYFFKADVLDENIAPMVSYEAMQKSAMKADFSWKLSANKYLKLYK